MRVMSGEDARTLPLSWQRVFLPPHRALACVHDRFQHRVIGPCALELQEDVNGRPEAGSAASDLPGDQVGTDPLPQKIKNVLKHQGGLNDLAGMQGSWV